LLDNAIFRYCKQYYHPNSHTQNIFLTLLRIYLQPTSASKSTTPSAGTATLLRPALDLISRHSPRLDTIETLQLLPPLVTTQDLKAYLFDALRAPVFDTKVARNIAKSRNEQVSRKLMVLQSQRVKITDSRMCVHLYSPSFGAGVLMKL
jgi:Vam6/Vps39-like protein vacuolar protein sorting-associated protein 39